MKKIQVDMYAVGLGAAILTQLRLGDTQVLSILADGGMGPGGYAAAGVRDRLGEAFAAFGNDAERKRIDLMVGTHYDSDHLKGLVPIAADNDIDIGDVWLPPVKDDTDEIPGHVSESGDYLALKFYDDEGAEQLRRYLEVKRHQVAELQENEARITGLLREQNVPMDELPLYKHVVTVQGRRALAERRPETVGEYVAYFEGQEADAAAVTGGEGAHSAARYDSSVKDLRDIASNFRDGRARDTLARIARIEGYLKDDPETLRLMPATLALIRKSTASGAITASHLHKLVQALRSRRQPVRPRCHYITSGEPVRFGWNPAKRRFVPGASVDAAGPVLALLGPSEWLVEKHREKLPVGSYLAAIGFASTPIRLEGITASNQLSYIFTLETEGQRILISGDAGCYGFKDEDGDYWPELLKALQRLNVVQVAHHAGHNYDFYNALLAAGFAAREAFAYLLVSHAVRDPKRPSDAFGQFVAQARGESDALGLLFTSEPDQGRVDDFDELILPVAPAGRRARQGDVRMVYGEDEEGGWKVERHAVAV